MTVSKFKKFAMYAMVAGALTIGTQSCSDGKVEADKYDNVTTTLVEYEKGQFRIEDEVVTKILFLEQSSVTWMVLKKN